MSEEFLRIKEKRNWTFSPDYKHGDFYIDVAAEIDCSAWEAGALWNDPSPGTLLDFLPEGAVFWQFEQKNTSDAILLVDYPKDACLTVFATTAGAYADFLDYLDEGLDLVEKYYLG